MPQGIVIQDSEGNEFVWVPVDSVSKGANIRADDIRLGRYTFNTTNGTPTKKQDADNYTQTVLISSYQEKTNNDRNTAAKSLSTFVDKTKDNGGYYLARYEASYKSSTMCYSKKSTSTRDSSNTSLIKGMLWNFIAQPSAATVARNSFTSSYVESDLINSYSWDTAIVFIQKYSGNSNYANENGKSVSSSLENTGVNQDRVCNIHDMASNCLEWSTEHSTYVSGSNYRPCVHRGGSYWNMSVTFSTRTRYYANTTFSNAYHSFRPLLYIK